MPLRGRSCLSANSRCSRDGWGYSPVPIFRKRNLLSNLPVGEIAMAPDSGGSVASATPSRWKTFPHTDTRHSLSQSKRHPSEPEGTKCPCYPLFLSPAHAVSQAPRPPRPRARYVAIRSTHTLKDRRTPTRRRIRTIRLIPSHVPLREPTPPSTTANNAAFAAFIVLASVPSVDFTVFGMI